MTNSLKYIGEKFNLNLNQRQQPVEIKNSTRETLAELFCELDYKVGAEIGVEQGIYSEIILKKNPQAKLISVDCWEAYEGYRDHMEQEEMDKLYQITKDRLAPFGERSEIIKGYSMDVAKQFAPESLDFVYLDANHEFVHVVNDIAVWESKVKVGGIIAGHDYIRRRTNNFLMHVPMAVHGFVESYSIKPLFVLGRKEAKANTNPKHELRESTRSWFYVKPPHDPMRPGWEGWKDTLDSK